MWLHNENYFPASGKMKDGLKEESEDTCGIYRPWATVCELGMK